MTDHRKPKRYKSLFSWFQKTDTPPSGSESGSVSENRRGTENSVNDVPKDVPLVSSISIPVEECRSERIEAGGFDITSLERDPGLRRPICQYPLNDQENVRRAYVVLGPCQPQLSSYPSSNDTGQGRKFNHKWFKDWPWLEYSVQMDKAYCFPCFLFDRYPSHHPAFTEYGFQGWKNIMSKQSGILKHMGGINSPHNAAMHKWETLDILNALNFLKLAKRRLQELRENGWDALITRVASFCCENDIIMPDMSLPYKKCVRACEQNITNEHYYRVNILNAVIDFQLAELDNRFPDDSLELLVLSATLDPRDNFVAFKSEDVCNLALKFYPEDFASYDLSTLDMECGFFVADILADPRFVNTSSVSDLSRRLVESRKSAFFPMIYRLICLVLTLPVSTATTERAFSSMNIIKSRLRNKMEDDFLDDLMVLYIEKEFADSVDNDYVIQEFEVSGTRRVRFR